MTSDHQTPPNIWRFRDGEIFLGHTVSMRLEQQSPGRVPRVRHFVICDVCPDELELFGYSNDDIQAAYQRAVTTHHLKRLAERMVKLEQRQSHSGWGDEILA